MRGTLPILTCDSEEGCDQWVTDMYELGVMEWRENMPGWTYDPYKDRDSALCPDHHPDAVAARDAEYPEFHALLGLDQNGATS